MNRRNVVLPESTIAGVVGGDGVGRKPFAVAALWLYHLSQRGRGAYRTGAELVAGQPDHRLAQAPEVRPGLPRQGGIGRQPGGAVVEQKRHAHDGRHFDRAGAQPDHAALGAMESAGRTDAAFGSRADGPGLLRRLRENHSAERRWGEVAGETLGPGWLGIVHRPLFVAPALDERADYRDHGPLL